MSNDTNTQDEPEVIVTEEQVEEAPINATTLAEMEAGRAHLAKMAASVTAETA
jgi:hypothetical protein